MSQSLSRKPPPLLLLGATVGVCCALIPATYLVVRAGSISVETLGEQVLRGRIAEWSVNSALLVGAVALSSLVLGVLTAWLLTCTNLRGRNAWLVLTAMPLAVPSYVAAFGWLSTFPELRGFVPSWLILTAVSVPYVILPTAAAMRRADMSLVEVSIASGRSPWRAWYGGLWPQIQPAALAGTLLVGLYALSDFGAVALLRFEVLTFAIQRQYGSFVGRDLAAVLALLLVLGAALLVVAERRARGNAQRWSVSHGVMRAIRPVRLGAWEFPALLVALLPLGVAVVWPCIALFQRLTLGTRRPLDWAELGSAVAATAWVSVLGGAMALALAVCVGWLAARYRGRLVAVLEGMGFATHALPGIVVGLALVYTSLKLTPSLYQTVAVLVFAYGVLLMPKAIGAVRTSVAAVPPNLAQVASTLGRRPLRANLVTVRLASPGMAAGFLLVVVTAMKELPATLLLRPSELDTLATEMWSRTSALAQGAAAPYALALVLLSSVPAFLLSRQSLWGEK